MTGSAKRTGWLIIGVLFVLVFAYAVIGVPSKDAAFGSTQRAHDMLSKIEPKSIVWVELDLDIWGEARLRPAIEECLVFGLGQGLRFVLCVSEPGAVYTAEKVWTAVSNRLPHKQYGVDFVNLGLRNACETPEQIWSAFSGVDVYGKPLQDYPLMAELHSYDDIALSLRFCGSEPTVDTGLPMESVAIGATGAVEAGGIAALIASLSTVIRLVELLIDRWNRALSIALLIALLLAALVLYMRSRQKRI